MATGGNKGESVGPDSAAAQVETSRALPCVRYRHLDTVEVTGSIPVSPTSHSRSEGQIRTTDLAFLIVCHPFVTRTRHPSATRSGRQRHRKWCPVPNRSRHLSACLRYRPDHCQLFEAPLPRELLLLGGLGQARQPSRGPRPSRGRRPTGGTGQVASAQMTGGAA